MSRQHPIDVRTVVQLFAPKQMGIRLVPLSSVEEADHSLFWAAAFLSVAMCVLGSLISLAATTSSGALLIVLVIFAILFLGLFCHFAYRGFNMRRRARLASGGLAESPARESKDYDELQWAIANIEGLFLYVDRTSGNPQLKRFPEIERDQLVDRMRGILKGPPSTEEIQLLIADLVRGRVLRGRLNNGSAYCSFNQDEAYAVVARARTRCLSDSDHIPAQST